MRRESVNVAPCRHPQRLWWILLVGLVVHACTPSPQTHASEEAIRRYFQELGYEVVELSLGELRRNPPAERVYMAPLTYVVAVRSITLAAGTGEGVRRRVTSTGARVKLQASGGPDQGWVVSRVEKVELP